MYKTFLISQSVWINYYKMIAIDLSKKQELDPDTKAIQQITFTGNLKRGEDINGNTIMFFIIEETKETILDFSQETVRVLLFYLVLI